MIAQLLQHKKASIAILVLQAVLLPGIAHASQLGASTVVIGGAIWYAHPSTALLMRHAGQNTATSSRVLNLSWYWRSLVGPCGTITLQ